MTPRSDWRRKFEDLGFHYHSLDDLYWDESACYRFTAEEIDRLEGKYKNDPKVQEGAAKYRQLTKQQMVDAHLHIASSYTVSSSYNQAIKQVNAALSLDPKNGEALAQRARIEQAASEGIEIGIF